MGMWQSLKDFGNNWRKNRTTGKNTEPGQRLSQLSDEAQPIGTPFSDPAAALGGKKREGSLFLETTSPEGSGANQRLGTEYEESSQVDLSPPTPPIGFKYRVRGHGQAYVIPQDTLLKCAEVENPFLAHRKPHEGCYALDKCSLVKENGEVTYKFVDTCFVDIQDLSHDDNEKIRTCMRNNEELSINHSGHVERITPDILSLNRWNVDDRNSQKTSITDSSLGEVQVRWNDIEDTREWTNEKMGYGRERGQQMAKLLVSGFKNPFDWRTSSEEQREKRTAIKQKYLDDKGR